MRFGDLIVSVGGDESRLRFHPRLTVIGPLGPGERADLIETVLSAASGTRPEVQISATDGSGEILADLPGMLGPVAAPERLRRGMIITSADLRLADGPADRGDQTDLAATRIALAELHRQLERPRPESVDPEAAAELESLDLRLRDADEAEDRRAHFKAELRLGDVEAELDVLGALARSATADELVVAASKELSELGQRRRDLEDTLDRTGPAAQLARKVLGSGAQEGPAFEHADPALADLTGSSDPMTERFVAATSAWRQAAGRVRTLEVALSHHSDFDLEGQLDRRIALLAPLDQDELWTAHQRVREVERRFQMVTAARAATDDVAPEIEAELDVAHMERVRAEEVAQGRWRPGILIASVMAVLGLVGATANPLVGVGFLLATAAAVAIMIVKPRRALGEATAAENVQLERVGATTYLGLHLRRLADPERDGAQAELSALAQERTLATVAWKAMVGHLDPSEADGMEAEIRGHALRFNARLRAEHGAVLAEDLSTATLVRSDAQATLRAAAAALVAAVEQTADEAARSEEIRLAVLERLGVPDGPDAPESLAQQRVAALQRQRVREQARPKSAVEQERTELVAEVARLERPGWTGPPPLPPSTAAVSLLRRRRQELRSRLGLDSTADAQAQAQLATLESRLHQLERRDGQAAPGRESVARRLLARLALARDNFEGITESLPVALDDPLVSLPVDRRCDLLDMLLRVSERMQIIYLTDDPVVVRWSRQRAAADSLLLLEPVVEPV